MAESKAAVGTEFLSPYPPHTHTHGDPHGDPNTHGRPAGLTLNSLYRNRKHVYLFATPALVVRGVVRRFSYLLYYYLLSQR